MTGPASPCIYSWPSPPASGHVGSAQPEAGQRWGVRGSPGLMCSGSRGWPSVLVTRPIGLMAQTPGVLGVSSGPRRGACMSAESGPAPASLTQPHPGPRSFPWVPGQYPCLLLALQGPRSLPVLLRLLSPLSVGLGCPPGSPYRIRGTLARMLQRWPRLPPVDWPPQLSVHSV